MEKLQQNSEEIVRRTGWGFLIRDISPTTEKSQQDFLSVVETASPETPVSPVQSNSPEVLKA